MTSQLLSASFVPPRLFPSVLTAGDPLKVFLKDGSDGFLPVKDKGLPVVCGRTSPALPAASFSSASPPADCAPHRPPLLFLQSGWRSALRTFVLLFSTSDAPLP